VSAAVKLPAKTEAVQLAHKLPAKKVLAPKQNDIVSFISEAGPFGSFTVESVSEDGSLVVFGEDGGRWGCPRGAVKVVRESARRSKISLVDEPVQLDEGALDVTEPLLESLGFKPAPKEDFIGAGEKTFFLDVDTPAGISTVVYDLQPLGGTSPAAHAYYRSREGGIFESAACFSAKCSLAELKSLVKVAESLQPATSEKNKRLKSVPDLVSYLKTRAAPA
jgi:hypothetical protein